MVWVTISRYILTAVQYDSTLAPTAYKLRILVDVQFVDRATNQALWEEKNLESALTYPSSTLRGGTEEQAREVIWATSSKRVVGLRLGDRHLGGASPPTPRRPPTPSPTPRWPRHQPY